MSEPFDWEEADRQMREFVEQEWVRTWNAIVQAFQPILKSIESAAKSMVALGNTIIEAMGEEFALESEVFLKVDDEAI